MENGQLPKSSDGARMTCAQIHETTNGLGFSRDRAALRAALVAVVRYAEPGDDLRGNEVEMLHNCHAEASRALAKVQP